MLVFSWILCTCIKLLYKVYAVSVSSINGAYHLWTMCSLILFDRSGSASHCCCSCSKHIWTTLKEPKCQCQLTNQLTIMSMQHPKGIIQRQKLLLLLLLLYIHRQQNPGFCWRCLSPCWTTRASCSHIGDNCKWGSIPTVWGELAEDKGTSFGLQGRYAINH